MLPRTSLIVISAFCFLGIAKFGVSPAQADLVMTFSNGDQLEGDAAGGTASYTDPATLSTAVLTTIGLTDAAGSAGGAVLNPNGTLVGSLGINSVVADTADRFDDKESWEFKWDKHTSFKGINFANFDTADGERFVISSTDWVGLSGVSPGDSASIYNSAAGSFTLTNKGLDDDFDLNHISGGVALDVATGVSMMIAYANNSGGSDAFISDITFGISAIPEPTSFALFFGAVGFMGFHRRRSR